MKHELGFVGAKAKVVLRQIREGQISKNTELLQEGICEDIQHLLDNIN